ncbi:MAG: alpha/beta hydrolase [Lachnospiraceae bacterium]|nr:alpha/beta hydrolase [Lachnospiraceae bacterium]
MEQNAMIVDYLKTALTQMGDENFDVEAFMKTSTYQGIYAQTSRVLAEQDQGSERVLQYWESKGLKKELHGTDTWDTTWASYLPLSCVKNKDASIRYPLLFVLHGHENPIFLAECYGYLDIAASEELITIIPNNENADFIDELFDYAVEHYPVDLSRVYMVGYSLGGAMTSRHVLRNPERYAAAGVGGMLFASGVAGDVEEYEGFVFPGETFTDEMIAHAAEIKMPVVHSLGENEFHNLLPLYRDPGTDPAMVEQIRNSQIDWTGDNKIASVNNWRRVAGCRAHTREESKQIALDSADPVIRMLGYPFERTSVITRNACDHFVGNCINEHGENLARFIGVSGLPHFPSLASSELVWEFMCQFARNPKTHESYIIAH